jgi:hypothetical protein
MDALLWYYLQATHASPHTCCVGFYLRWALLSTQTNSHVCCSADAQYGTSVRCSTNFTTVARCDDWPLFQAGFLFNFLAGIMADVLYTHKLSPGNGYLDSVHLGACKFRR